MLALGMKYTENGSIFSKGGFRKDCLSDKASLPQAARKRNNISKRARHWGKDYGPRTTNREFECWASQHLEELD